MNERELAHFCERLATAYPVTLLEVESYWTITKHPGATTAACEAASLGYRHADIITTLHQSEATTVDGIAHWLREHHQIIGPR